MLSSWTEKEKLQLLRAIRKHGSSNLETVAKEIPNKTLHEVEYAVDLFSAAARKSLKANNRSRYRQAPIDKWIQFVRRHTLNARRTRDLATVFKIFAVNGELSSQQPDDVDFKNLYLFLADLSLGCAPRQLNLKTHRFLMKTIKELAYKYKHETTDKELELVSELTRKNLRRPTAVKDDNELEEDDDEGNDITEDFLENNQVLNPLKIDASFLKNKNKQGQNRLNNGNLSKLKQLARAMKRKLV